MRPFLLVLTTYSISLYCIYMRYMILIQRVSLSNYLWIALARNIIKFFENSKFKLNKIQFQLGRARVCHMRFYDILLLFQAETECYLA